ncbi:hypothetical protein L3X38_009533 [Prunus dulcis]|uniref:Uncharacterized protein n=1 Tax=Prunus dulcis TaxID=3755 RepID=A0AAD4WDU1_PRUDU|nr:hypothetical protein L3X38_009533 [Prunus dulcis]
MQDLNRTLQDPNEHLEEQQIGLQVNLWKAQKKATKDSSSTRRVERCLFGEESASTPMPQTSNFGLNPAPEGINPEEDALVKIILRKEKGHVA